MIELEVHEYALIFPAMQGQDLRELADDIQTHGLRDDIVTYQGKILDGRNRQTGCQMAKVEPRFVEFIGEDPLAFVISKNMKRRQMSIGQKGVVAAKIAQLPKGRPVRQSDPQIKSANLQIYSAEQNEEKTTFSAKEAAEQMGVSTRIVSEMKKILREGSPEQIERIERGETTVHAVAKEIKAEKSKPADGEKAVHLDKMGFPIPEGIWDDWQRADEFRESMTQIQRIKLTIKKGLEDDDKRFAEITNGAVAQMANVHQSLEQVIPYAVCTTCQGKKPDGCLTCKGRGYMSKFRFDTAIPENIRTMRVTQCKR